jgi:hypothetical protein
MNMVEKMYFHEGGYSSNTFYILIKMNYFSEERTRDDED